MIKNRLFNDFNRGNSKTWEDLIHKDLKGADYNKKLLSETIEKITVNPYYTKDNLTDIPFLKSQPGHFPFIRGNNNSQTTHKIRQHIVVIDFYEANLKANQITDKGVTSLGFDLNNISTISKENLSVLLKNINLKEIEINFLSWHLPNLILDLFRQYISEYYKNNELVSCSIDFDPLGYKTIYGTFYNDIVPDYKITLQALFEQSEDLTNFKIININASNFRNAGSSAVQELAYGLSIGSEYLYAASDIGIDIQKLAPKMIFTFGIGSNYFMEIAKIRAARLLWAKIIETYGVSNLDSAKMYIHSQTSDWNKTAYDPYVNVLRTTTEAMSAIIGGTDSLLVRPFNSSYDKSDDFSERIARNTQIILNEEAYFDKFIDPAGGSYYIENLTNSIAEKSWDLFVEIEKQGGYNTAFDKGIIKKDIEETAAKRDMAIAQKKEILLGTNQYPAKDEKITINKKEIKQIGDNAIRLYRGAEAFEELRQITVKAEITPKVLLLKYGNLAMRKARATFAVNFFACAGFEIIDEEAVNSINDGVKLSQSIKPDIIVICSSDDEYPDIVPKLNVNIGNDAIVVVAGYPKNHLEALKKDGIDNFIHVKSNILETLTDFQNILLKK